MGSPVRITSLTNPHVKAAVKLRDGHHRRKLGETIVEEQRSIQRAMDAGLEVRELFVCPELAGPSGQDFARLLANQGITVFEVPPQVLEKLAYRQHPEGLAAIVKTPQHALADVQWPQNCLLVVVEHLEKPGNLGAILRSLDGAGGSGLILCDRVTDVYNPNVIRASTGVVFSVPVVEAPVEEAVALLHARGVKLLAASPQAAQPYTSIDMTGPVAIVLGSEHLGLSEALEAACDAQDFHPHARPRGFTECGRRGYGDPV